MEISTLTSRTRWSWTLSASLRDSITSEMKRARKSLHFAIDQLEHSVTALEQLDEDSVNTMKRAENLAFLALATVESAIKSFEKDEEK